MSKLSTLTSRGRFLGAAAALTLVSVASALSPMMVSADQIEHRSMTLSSTVAGDKSGDNVPGSSTNGAKVSYTFRFQAATTSNLQSMSFMFCDTAFGYIDAGDGSDIPLGTACVGAPTGFDASKAPDALVTIGANSEATWTTAASVKDNVIKISASSAVATNAADEVVVKFVADATHYIKNPTTETYTSGNFQNTFFSHIVTYSDNAWTTKKDDGTVTSAITKSIGITARVQETLRFSVGTRDLKALETYGGVTEDLPAVGATCDPLVGSNTLTMGDINGALSTTAAHDALSYFRVSTNAVNGTDINYAGKTLTSGSKTIAPSPTTGAVSTINTEQFGLGLVTSGDADWTINNSGTYSLVAPAYGAAVGTITGAPSGTASFAFDPASNGKPVTIISFLDNIICDTGVVRYVGNIDGNTPAGIYRTSINYIAVPRY